MTTEKLVTLGAKEIKVYNLSGGKTLTFTDMNAEEAVLSAYLTRSGICAVYNNDSLKKAMDEYSHLLTHGEHSVAAGDWCATVGERPQYVPKKLILAVAGETFEAKHVYGQFCKIDDKLHIILEDSYSEDYITSLFNELTEKSFIKLIGAETLANWARGNYSLDDTCGEGAYSFSEWLSNVVSMYDQSVFSVCLNNHVIDELGFQRDWRSEFMMVEVDTMLQVVLEELKGA